MSTGRDRGGRGGRGGQGRGDSQRGSSRGRGDADRGGRGRGDGQSRGPGGPRGGGDRGRGGQSQRGQSSQMAYHNRPSGGIYLAGQQVSPPDPNIIRKEDESVANLRGRIIDGLPGRPGYGTLGKKIALYANYLQISAHPESPDVPLYRYHVEVTPDLKSKPKQRQLIAQLLGESIFNGVTWATDYSAIIVTTKKIDFGNGQDHGEKKITMEAPGSSGQQSTALQAPVFVQQARQRNTVKCKIQYTRSYSLDAMMQYLSSESGGAEYAGSGDLVQLLNIIICKPPNASFDVAKVGNNKFYPFNGHPLTEMFDLKGPFQAHRGYYSSVRPAVDRLLMNINVVHGAFYEPGPLANAIAKFGGSLEEQEGFLLGLKVNAIYKLDGENSAFMKKEKKILCFAKKNEKDRNDRTIVRYLNAREATFKFKDSSQPNAQERDITVFDYFKNRWNITLRQPELKVLNVATANDPQYIPQEICNIPPGQPYNKLLGSEQTADMIRHAARHPNVNAMSIAGTQSDPGNGVKLFQLATRDVQTGSVKRFGLQVNPKMITVPGRVLDPPHINYEHRSMQAQGASWNLTGVKFFKGGSFKKWAALTINHNRERQSPRYALNSNPNEDTMTPEALFDLLGQQLANYKVTMGTRERTQNLMLQDLTFTNRATNNKTLSDAFEQAKKLGVQIFFVVLPSQDKWLYSRIKYYGDVLFGIHTVCAQGSKIQKPHRDGRDRNALLQFFGNEALKFNVKGGGVSHQVQKALMDPLGNNTIIFGIDVTHPSPGSTNTAPSVACVVANTDSNLFQWPGSIRVQTGRQEMVQNLTEMVEERLRIWYRNHRNTLPDKVIIYRDGVSEGQFHLVLQRELPLFKAAYQKAYGDKSRWPKTAIIICGKRHHTRFYPTREQEADTAGRASYNPRPGTIVDRGIVGKVIHEFFLQAHQGLQGTAKPCHYSVIKDDIGFTADQLQDFTHKLCYSFGRCTKAISVCPPAYYADLLAERGRQYLFPYLQEDRGAKFDINTADWTKGVHPDVSSVTWYI